MGANHAFEVPPRLLMGPGPRDVSSRVLAARIGLIGSRATRRHVTLPLTALQTLLARLGATAAAERIYADAG